VIQAVGVLEVSLSEEVIIGAIAIRRGATVLLTLLPAALGLALGAGQGSTLGKNLLSTNRLPARLAGVVILLCVPTLAALLAVINQLLASVFATLACLATLFAMLVWLPLGVTGTLWKMAPKALSGGTTGPEAVPSTPGKRAALTNTEVLLEPADQEAIVRVIGYRKWMVSFWMLCMLLFAGLFFGMATASSLVTEQIEEFKLELSGAAAQGTVFTTVFVPTVQLILEAIAKCYLAQVFYLDAVAVAITKIWHDDKADPPEVIDARRRELSDVADALGLDAELRHMTRARPPKGSTGSEPEA